MKTGQKLYALWNYKNKKWASDEGWAWSSEATPCAYFNKRDATRARKEWNKVNGSACWTVQPLGTYAGDPLK